MKLNRSRLSWMLLLSISLITTSLAIFYAWKLNRIEKKFSKLENAETAVIQNQNDDPLIEIDSLLMNGEYDLALQIIDSNRTSESIDGNQHLLLRQKFASEFISLKKLRPQNTPDKTNRSSAKNLSNELTTEEEEYDKISVELVAAQIKIANLEKQLKDTSVDGYLNFKTTKGISVHYVGAINNKKANGYGIAILESGSRYEGEWSDNQRHGEGKFFWDDGDYYEGNYMNDMRDGYGVYHWGNGEFYEGMWKNDMRNGEGKFYNKRGKLKVSGFWENDELITQE